MSGGGGGVGGGGTGRAEASDEASFGTTDKDTSDHGVSGRAAAESAASAPSHPSSGSQPRDSSNEDNSGAGSGSSGSGSGSGGGSEVPQAPGYVASVVSAPKGGPKGKNLTEGGFEADDSKNASLQSEIGGEDDPGRVAEEKMQKVNESARAGGGRGRGWVVGRQGLMGI